MYNLKKKQKTTNTMIEVDVVSLFVFGRHTKDSLNDASPRPETFTTDVIK